MENEDARGGKGTNGEKNDSQDNRHHGDKLDDNE